MRWASAHLNLRLGKRVLRSPFFIKTNDGGNTGIVTCELVINKRLAHTYNICLENIRTIFEIAAIPIPVAGLS